MLVIDGMMVRLGEFSLKANFSVPRDVTRLAIVGPSGSGKSTFLGALGGFVPLDSGRIYYDDTEISAASAVARPIAHLFQDNNLFPHMSAAQNVGLGIVPNLRLTQEDRELVEHALDAVGIGGMGERLPAQLSGGQQSRVALARILVQRQPIVLLDEPFSALGPAMRVEMTSLARQVGEDLGALMLMVSHDLEDARRFSDQVVWVNDGMVHAPKSWDAIAAAPPDGYRAYAGED